MRNIFLFFLIIFSANLMAQNLRLKMPADLYYSRTPSQNKLVKFTVTTKLTAINLITTDNQNSERLAANSTNRRAVGRSGLLLAIPKLYKINANGNVKTYSFGQNGGENNNDDATVTLTYQNAAPSNTSPSNQPPVIFQVANNEIHTARNAATPFTNKQQFLKVEASSTNTATIRISRNTNQGNTIVAIFDSRSGNLLATLNPKDPDNSAETLSFTIDKSAYIIPVIRPKVSNANGKDRILFEVGDPEVNGEAESEEE